MSKENLVSYFVRPRKAFFLVGVFALIVALLGTYVASLRTAPMTALVIILVAMEYMIATCCFGVSFGFHCSIRKIRKEGEVIECQ